MLGIGPHSSWLEFNVPLQRKYGYVRDDETLFVSLLTSAAYVLDNQHLLSCKLTLFRL